MGSRGVKLDGFDVRSAKQLKQLYSTMGTEYAQDLAGDLGKTKLRDPEMVRYLQETDFGYETVKSPMKFIRSTGTEQTGKFMEAPFGGARKRKTTRKRTAKRKAKRKSPKRKAKRKAPKRKATRKRTAKRKAPKRKTTRKRAAKRKPAKRKAKRRTTKRKATRKRK